MRVKDAMSTNIETVSPGMTVRECVRKMAKANVGALPVWEKGRLISMVIDRDDCCRAIGDSRDPATMTAREIMTPQIVSCFEDEDCIDTAHQMKAQGLRQLAVLSRTQNMVGLLSVDDLARHSLDLAGAALEAAAPWPH